MKYEGNLYGKIGRKYVQLIDTTKDIEAKDARIAEFEAELTAEREKVERLREALTNIHDYGLDRDGETTAEKLGELVDELVKLAREALAATASDKSGAGHV